MFAVAVERPIALILTTHLQGHQVLTMCKLVLIETVIRNIPSFGEGVSNVLWFQRSHRVLKDFGFYIGTKLEVWGEVWLHEVVVLVVVHLSAMDGVVGLVGLRTDGGGQTAIVRKNGTIKGGNIEIHTVSTHDVHQPRIERREGAVSRGKEVARKLELVLVQ